MLNEIKFQGNPPKIVPLIYSIIEKMSEKTRFLHQNETVKKSKKKSKKTSPANTLAGPRAGKKTKDFCEKIKARGNPKQ